MNERVWRYAFGGHDYANLDAIIERVERYNCRSLLSELKDTLGGRDPPRLEGEIVRVWTST